MNPEKEHLRAKNERLDEALRTILDVVMDLTQFRSPEAKIAAINSIAGKALAQGFQVEGRSWDDFNLREDVVRDRSSEAEGPNRG